MSDDARLRVSGVRFGYPGCGEFLGPIDVSLAGGALLAIVGPNGAGKSTLLRLMVGLLHPRSGTVSIEGRRVDRLSARARATLMAFLPQRPAAPTDLTAREVVLLGRFPHGRFAFFDSAEDVRVAERAMETTAIAALADHCLDTLSSGEQQRVHLAGAIAQEPRLLVLDEPTTALDPYHQLSVFEVLRALCAERGVTVIVATHDLNFANEFADRVLLLSEGKVVKAGGADEVLRPEVLEPVYSVRFEAVGGAPGTRRWILPASIRGDPTSVRGDER